MTIEKLVSYKPLRITLAEKDMDINELESRRGGVLNVATVTKLRRDQFVNIETIAKICVFLDVPVEKVVKINRI